MLPTKDPSKHANTKLPWYRWYLSDWYTSEACHWPWVAQGIYRALLDQVYVNGGYLPNDEKKLCRLVGIGKKDWTASRELVLSKFQATEDGTKLFNSRGLSEITFQHEWQERQRSNGKRGGKASAFKRQAQASLDQASSEPQASLNRPSSQQEQEQEQEQEQDLRLLSIERSSKPDGLDQPASSFPALQTEIPLLELQPDPEPKPDSSPVKKNMNGLCAEIFGYYLEKTGRNPKLCELTEKRRAKFTAICPRVWTKTGCDMEKTRETFHYAIDRLVESDFHMGRLPKTNGKKYIDWEKHLMPDWERFERWLNE